MSARPKHHRPKIWAQDRGDKLRWAVMTLVNAFGIEDRRSDRSGTSWKTLRDGDAPGTSELRWFANAPPRRPFLDVRGLGYWRPRYFREERRSYWQRPPVQRPCD